MTEPIETTAVIVREPEQPDVEATERQPTTAAQAKIDAVASLTMAAYQKASQLLLTQEEVDKLTADFPDEAFRPGAGGKENLIYIEHAYLRDRLNQVFSPGQWAIVPRNRWSEDFTTKDNKPAIRIYVEAMLCVRGCFVAEAVGDMEYYPHNAGTNYGDCVEGAKSGCLRRCAKELGIGLQAWKRDWCEGWWQRKRGQKPPPSPTPFSKPASKPPEPKKATVADVLPAKEATPATRDYMFKMLSVHPEEGVKEYAIKHGFILDSEDLIDWGLGHVPTTQQAIRKLVDDVGRWLSGEVEVERRDDLGEPFWKAIVPIPHKGQPRAEYLKNPDTIGSLYLDRHNEDGNSRKRLFGFAHHFEPKPWVNNSGKEQPPGKADMEFREALDAFLAWYEQNHPDERTT